MGRSEVAPHIKELDREHRFDPRILPQMARARPAGRLRSSTSSAARAWTTSALGLASEELEYVDTSLRVILSVHVGLNSLTLLAWGTEDQKQRYLVPQAQGTKIATFGLTEPAAGSDARGIQTVAIKHGDSYRITGEKMWISLADVADNFLVFAWTDLEKKKPRDTSGISAFIVERAYKGSRAARSRRSGASSPATPATSRWTTWRCRRRTWSDAKAKASRSRCSRSTRAATRSRPGATGLIRACRDASAKYAHERKTFGVEIGEHQLVKEMIAQMESDYQAARAALAARRLAEEHRPPQHARDRPREVVRHGRLGAGRRRCRAGPRRQRVLRRVPGRPLLPQLQGRRDLRGHARDPQA